MCSVRQMVAVLCVLAGAGELVRGQESGSSPPRGVARARPAVLILRVTDPPASEPASRRMDVIAPRGLRTLPFDANDPQSYSADGAPQLGNGCDLVRSYASDVDGPNVHYFVYQIDFSDPFVARNWAEFQRVQRQEARQARAEWQNDRAWEKRKQHLLGAHAQATNEGVDFLRAGQYREAIISLTRASELNQSDPACRIHLAQARVALGHDGDAARVLRQALELQPKLVPTQLALEQYYPHEEDFTVQVDSLARRLAANPSHSADAYLLLGFMTFQRGWMDDAYLAFRQADRLKPDDHIVRSYLGLTKPARRAK
jgi:Flp pilus assembly protein TadD